MRRAVVPVLVVLIALGAGAIAAELAPRREWPARSSEVEAMRSFEREAQELEQARQRLVARAQAVFAEARERLALTPEEGARLRFDDRGRCFYLADVAPETSAR